MKDFTNFFSIFSPPKPSHSNSRTKTLTMLHTFFLCSKHEKERISSLSFDETLVYQTNHINPNLLLVHLILR